MTPIFVFVIVLIVIWSLSTVASIANKQKEQERRRLLAQQLQRASGAGPALGTDSGPRRISEGIAARFPDVLLPPTPQRSAMRQQQQPLQRPVSALVKAMRPVARAAAKVRRPVAANAARPPASASGVMASPAAPPPAAPLVQRVQRDVAQGVAAPAISSWLKPNVLRQQFILTEIFQPPLALREYHF